MSQATLLSFDSLSIRNNMHLIKHSQNIKALFRTLIVLHSIFSQYACNTLTTSSPILNLSPQDIQTGRKSLAKASETTLASHPYPEFFQTFNITLTSISTSDSYHTCLSMSRWQFSFSLPANPVYHRVYVENPDASQVEIGFYVSQTDFWTLVGINYLLISSTYGPFQQQLIVEDHHVSPSDDIEGNELLTFTSGIAIDSSKSYFHTAFLTGIKLAPIQPPSEIFFSLNINRLNTLQYDLNVASNAIEIGDIHFGFMVFESTLEDLHGRYRTRFNYFSTNAYPSTLPGSNYFPNNLTVTEDNIFFGLYMIDATTDYEYQVSMASGDMLFQRGAQTSDLRVHVWGFFGVQCSSGFFYSEAAGTCLKCTQYCQQCTEIECTTCKANFTQSGADARHCECAFDTISGLCYDFENDHNLKGCNSAFSFVNGTSGNQQINCFECNSLSPDYLAWKSNSPNSYNGDDSCQCIEGYKKNTWNETCTEICGDGLVFQEEIGNGSTRCDDGNNISGDGCDSGCLIEENTGFECTTNSSKMTVCRSTEALSFEVSHIQKNSNNSAYVTISSNDDSLAFPFDASQFPLEYSSSLIKYEVSLNDNLIVIESHLTSVTSHSLVVLINFEFTIETLPSLISINTSNTLYDSEFLSTVNFTSIGNNSALKYSNYLQAFESTSTGIMVTSSLALILLVVGLIAPKYIGLETILALEIIYYSQLLIVDPSDWPVGFLYLKYLKMSTGYNQNVVELTDYGTVDTLSKKYLHLGLQKTFVENFNVSFAVLIIGIAVFWFGYFKRVSAEKEYIAINSTTVASKTAYSHRQHDLNSPQPNTQQPLTEAEKRKLSLEKEHNFGYWILVSETLHRLSNQIALWSLLQILCALSTQLLLRNGNVIVSEDFQISSDNDNITFETVSWQINGLMCLIAFVTVCVFGFNEFYTTLLHPISVIKLQERPSEQMYKKVKFVYLFVIGLCLFFMNDIILFSGAVPMSAIVLAAHLLYCVVLYRIHPYKKSLNIHTYGLIANNALIAIFLIVINLINFFPSNNASQSVINEDFILGLGFSIVGGCCVLIFFTAVRLYYEYRYGQVLQKKIQMKRQIEEKERLRKEEEELNNKMELYELEAKRKVDPKSEKRKKNRYLYENQEEEDKKNDLLFWLEGRHNWSKEKKEEYYFKHFTEKPMQWLKRNNQIEYERRQREEDKQITENFEKKKQKEEDPELKELKARLKKQLKLKKKLVKQNSEK